MEIIRSGAPEGVFTATANSQARSKKEQVYEGIIVDIIIDHKHPEYSKKDGYNIGAAKIRIFSIHNSLNDDELTWAFPMDTTILEYPLIGELVSLDKIRSEFFYTRKIPIARRLQENGMLKLNDQLNERSKNTLRSAVQQNVQQFPSEHQFGKYFKPDSRVRQLKHFEGDTIIQSRMGSTIRMGSSQMDPSSKSMAPNIILRAGQGKDVEVEGSKETIFGLVVEDAEKDVSSIWMTTDQTIPFLPVTQKTGALFRSMKSPPQKYDKASILINSDRVIINSKKTSILLFSKEEIYLNAFKRISLDTNGDVYVTSNKDIEFTAGGFIQAVADKDMTLMSSGDFTLASTDRISLISDKIHIGTISKTYEPMVGGTSLSIFLARLILTLMGTGVTPPQFPPYQLSGTPIPPLANALPKVAAPGIAATAHVIVTPGLPGVPVPAPLNPVIIGGLVQLYTELVLPNLGSTIPTPFSGAPFNSSDVFTTLATEDTSQFVPSSEFEEGDLPTEIKNNEWKLSEQYYKIT